MGFLIVYVLTKKKSQNAGFLEQLLYQSMNARGFVSICSDTHSCFTSTAKVFNHPKQRELFTVFDEGIPLPKNQPKIDAVQKTTRCPVTPRYNPRFCETRRLFQAQNVVPRSVFV